MVEKNYRRLAFRLPPVHIGDGANDMSLRDWFAGRVLPTMIELNGKKVAPEFNVASAYGYADAMIKFRNKEG